MAELHHGSGTGKPSPWPRHDVWLYHSLPEVPFPSLVCPRPHSQAQVQQSPKTGVPLVLLEVRILDGQRCNRDGQKCPGRCWCCHSPASQDSSFQSHLFLLATASPALARALGELPAPRLSHGVVFGAERGEVSPVPSLPTLCWGHEWGWLAWPAGGAVISRGSQVDLSQENLPRICLGKVYSRATQRGSPAMYQAGFASSCPFLQLLGFPCPCGHPPEPLPQSGVPGHSLNGWICPFGCPFPLEEVAPWHCLCLAERWGVEHHRLKPGLGC